MYRLPVRVFALIFSVLTLVTACGGGGSGNGGNQTTYTVGGTVSGLTGTVILQNNGGDNLSISADGNFTFTTALNDGSVYNVSVATQPSDQTCNVTNASAPLSGANVTSVIVSCNDNSGSTYTVGGSVTGLIGTLELQNNNGDNLSITTDGSFTFPTALSDSSAYNVTVLTQPSSQTCTVNNDSGTLSGANVTNVDVTCVFTATLQYTIGGTVTGLTGTVVLKNNGGDNLSLSNNGGFTFATPITFGNPYNVTVATQPSGQNCTVDNASGTVSGSNITNVTVSCSDIPTYTVGGTIGGLSGTVVLQINGGGDLSRSADGSFTFATPLNDGTAYTVSVLTQPSGQTCAVSNASGTLNGANITNVAVTCTDNSGPMYTVGGTLSGLTGTVVLQNNGGDNLTRSANGGFTFATALNDGSTYSVTVATQPSGQTCNVVNASGTLNGANVTNVAVTCTDNTSGGGGTGDNAYLFYAGSINAVDPAAPATPITVEAGDIVSDAFGALDAAAVTIQAGTYDDTTKALSDVHAHAVIYAKTDGHFYKVDAQKGGSLTPVQVSSESAADGICLFAVTMGRASYSIAAFPDFADPDNSQLVYSFPGADATCSTYDDEWKMVRLNMGAGDAPVSAKPPVAVLRDTSTGAVSGWLVYEPAATQSIPFTFEGDLKRCDTDFANCGASLASDFSKPTALLSGGMNRYVLNTGMYDGNANIFSSTPNVGNSDTLAADNTNVYYESKINNTVYRAPLDGSSGPTAMVTETVDIRYTQQMVVTDSKVVYAVNGDSAAHGAQVRAVDKTATGGTSTILASSDVLDSSVLLYKLGNKIYYSFISNITGFLRYDALAAGMVDDDGGNKVELAAASWAGVVFADNLDMDASSTSTTAIPGLEGTPKTILRLEGFEAQGSGKGFALGTMRAFNAADGTEIAVLGTLPNVTISGLACWGVGSGDNALCSNGYYIFFVNGVTANSLQQVIDNSGKSKFPLS